MALYGYNVPKKHQRTQPKTAFLTGPCIEFQYIEDGQIVERQGHIGELYQNGVYWVIASDHPDIYPRHFFLNDYFPWNQYKSWVVESWARLNYLPFCFTLKKKIGDDLIGQLRLLDNNEFQDALVAMRKKKILDPLRKLTSRMKPGEMTWDQIKAACYSSPPRT